MNNKYAKILGTSLMAAMPLCSYCEEKPNVVIIFIDDMGYADIAPFGSTIHPTPNMQKLADDGICHKEFYISSTNSTPSRSALMTGCYASTVGMGYRVVYPADVRGLNTEETILPEIFKSKGYVTGCFGKWHLSDNLDFMPIAHGFDEFEGLPYSADMWRGSSKGWPDLPYLIGEEVVASVRDKSSHTLITELTSNNAVDFINRHNDEPFFLYIPYPSLHNPRYVRKENVDKNNGDVFAAQLEEIDNGVGDIIEALKEHGIYDNTLILLSSDNGGGNGTDMGELRGQKGGIGYEGRHRASTIVTYPKKIKAGTSSNEIISSIDIFPSFATLIGADTSVCKPLDGLDQLDVLLGDKRAKSQYDTLYLQHEGLFDCMRVGDMKLVKNKENYELYNLKEDIGERNNLSSKYPDKVVQMKSSLIQFRKRMTKKQRPCGFVATPKPLIPYGDEDLPTLYEYKNLPKYEAVTDTNKKVKK